jgi:hypothetical protein
MKVLQLNVSAFLRKALKRPNVVKTCIGVRVLCDDARHKAQCSANDDGYAYASMQCKDVRHGVTLCCAMTRVNNAARHGVTLCCAMTRVNNAAHHGVRVKLLLENMFHISVTQRRASSMMRVNVRQ